ncbi:hypothetical protein ACHWQZ_G004642 [Mnemiopsis leidyi]
MFFVLLFSFPVLSTGEHLLSRHKGTVYQSTTSSQGVPGRAVDGNHKQHYGDNSCTHTYPTSSGTGNWWLIDLGQRAHVVRIKIWNRGHWDCCEERINGARVWVDGIQVAELRNSQREYHLHTSVTGRYVRVTQDHNVLTLCEVEVYGNYIGESGEGPNYYHHPILVSRHRPTSISGGSNSNGAVDGVFKGTSGRHGDCARTDYSAQSWWQVDLDQDYKVSMVVLYAIRGRETLLGAKVLVDDALCGIYGASSLVQELHAIKCPSGGLVGSKVRVVRDNNYIELCEAEVFGVKSEPKPTTPPTDPPTDPPTPIPDPSCKDLDSNCPILVAQQKCSSDPTTLAKCPLSCHQCSCGDNFRNCQKMQELGLCQYHESFMHKHCRKSCELCECVDSQPHCIVGASQGLCTSDPSFLALCPLSCNQCQCGDNLKHCSAMALAGQCVDNPSYMLVHCAESCNQCGNCADNPPFSAQCAERVARGECETNGDMAIHCAASCNFCEGGGDDDGSDSSDDEHPWI